MHQIINKNSKQMKQTSQERNYSPPLFVAFKIQTKWENSSQMTSLLGERAYLVYIPTPVILTTDVRIDSVIFDPPLRANTLICHKHVGQGWFFARLPLREPPLRVLDHHDHVGHDGFFARPPLRGSPLRVGQTYSLVTTCSLSDHHSQQFGSQ